MAFHLSGEYSDRAQIVKIYLTKDFGNLNTLAAEKSFKPGSKFSPFRKITKLLGPP
jgi:hypothetical protein